MFSNENIEKSIPGAPYLLILTHKLLPPLSFSGVATIRFALERGY